MIRYLAMSEGARFHTTRWSLVLAAGAQDDSSSAGALASLCEDYWYPIYSYIRRIGHSSEDAADLTQGYFAELLEKGRLKAADPSRGKFRSFLLATVKQHLSHEREKRRARKRGGDREIVPLEAGAAEDRLRVDGAPNRSPEGAFEHAWALTVLDCAKRSLEAEFASQGKEEQYRVLGRYLGGDREVPYTAAAEELGTSESAIKMAVRRLRKRFGLLVREEIASTIGPSGNIEAELAHLIAVLRR